VSSRKNLNTVATTAMTFVCIAAALLAGGCAAYRPVQSEYRLRGLLGGPQIVLSPPAGWLEKNVPAGSARMYMFTRDGVPLENITVRATPVGKKLQNSERMYRADMLPQEVAELTMGLLQTEDNLNALKCEQIELVQLAGQDAYKANYTYTDQNGLKKRGCLLGTILDGHVIEVGFDAADEVYYDRYVADFENVVNSIRRM
jgi:hypothetical protein